MDVLERTVDSLCKKGVGLLKVRLSELDIVASNSEELVNKAKEIVIRNKELQEHINLFQEQINYLDKINHNLTKQANFDSLSLKLDNKLDHESKLLLELNSALGKRSNLINTVEQLQEGVKLLENVASTNMTAQKPESQAVNTTINLNKGDTNTPLDSCSFINIEERMKRVIVAALNEKNKSPMTDQEANVSKTLKKEPRKKINSKPIGEKKFFKSQNESAKDKIDNSANFYKNQQKTSSQYDYPDPKGEKVDSKSCVVKISNNSSSNSNSNSNNNSNNNNSNTIEATSGEEKKPLLITFKIDRRDNSASVKSPSLSPDKSPSKSPKDHDHHHHQQQQPQQQQQRKQCSPENAKKSRYVYKKMLMITFFLSSFYLYRSPKYNSSIQSVNNSEKCSPLIIKLNSSQSNSPSFYTQNKTKQVLENAESIDKSSDCE